MAWTKRNGEYRDGEPSTEKHPDATKTPIKIAMGLDPWSGDFEIIQAGFIQCSATTKPDEDILVIKEN